MQIAASWATAKKASSPFLLFLDPIPPIEGGGSKKGRMAQWKILGRRAVKRGKTQEGKVGVPKYMQKLFTLALSRITTNQKELGLKKQIEMRAFYVWVGMFISPIGRKMTGLQLSSLDFTY